MFYCFSRRCSRLQKYSVGRFTVSVPKINQLNFSRWLNRKFDICVSFTFFSKTLNLLVPKNGSKQVNSINFDF